MQLIFSAAVVLLMFVGLPVWLLVSLRKRSMGEIMFGDQNHRQARSGLSNALQELGRLVAKPSIEYRIEAEDPDKLVEDEKGGD
ncbi:MAG TPA: hypothetical protein VFE46_15635 [Pirellulales bacterium]|jgi:hypothetical protein|nr:hypothetical protein [Pirellulales bacterium]